MTSVRSTRALESKASLAQCSSSEPPRKRRRNTPSTPAKGKVVANSFNDCNDKPKAQNQQVVSPKISDRDAIKPTPRKDKNVEKRLRQFRKWPPQSYEDRLERALSQRMFVIDRVRHEVDGCPEEVIELAGSTGNVYEVTIGRQPSCTCPDNQKGNQCKHIVYVLHLVLKAPPNLQYQLAFLTTELHDMFSLAPLPKAEELKKESEEHDSKRKPMEHDCPVCFTEFEPKREEVVWCKTCGNNTHKMCFERWATSQKGKQVTCMYCRSPWQGDEDSVSRIKEIRARGRVNEEGYVNVGAELGLSNRRDTSTYHDVWLRQQIRRGCEF